MTKIHVINPEFSDAIVVRSNQLRQTLILEFSFSPVRCDMVALTENYILAKSRCDSLDVVRNLNLWGNELTDISILRNMPAVEIVSLSVNNISTLEDISHCNFVFIICLMSDIDRSKHHGIIFTKEQHRGY